MQNIHIKEKVKFFKFRLKNASYAELIYRIKQFYLINKLYFFSKKFVLPSDLKAENLYNPTFIPDLKINFSAKVIDNISEKNIRKLFIDLSEISKNEEKISKLYFSKINYQYSKFDIRTIWEKERLQRINQILCLIERYQDCNLRDNIKEKCKTKIINWIDSNPFLYGPNYISAMECGLRIIVFFNCLKKNLNISKTEKHKILNTIFLHAWWISKRLSLFSSLGNHTIAECVGLIIAGTIFRDFREGKRWVSKGIQILEQESKHQILIDGGPAEQSFHYHRFVLDLYWFAIDFCEKNKLHDFLKVKSRLILGEKFLSAFDSYNDKLPLIGDSDEGFAIAPDVSPKRPIIQQHKKRTRIFKNSGYTIINSLNGAQLIFDHGPLGLPPFYNHGHADALSINLNKNGKKIFVDPGTYIYNGSPKWRQYFKGTRAHNTITIDGCDQAVQETGFIWSHPYDVELLSFSESADFVCISAMHNGYQQLEKPVGHKRDILFFDETCFLIKDSFQGKGLHTFELNFHLHPEVVLSKQKEWWQINNNGARIYMQMLENSDFFVMRGSKDPIHGWYSPCYGKKIKCNVMSCKKKGPPHKISFITAICTEELNETKKLQSKLIYFD